MFAIASLPLILGLCFITSGRAVAVDHRSEEHVTASSVAGYPFGKPFTDAYMIGPNHRRIAAISAVGCEPHGHLTNLWITYRDNFVHPELESPVSHGSSDIGQETRDFSLKLDEYITEVRVTTSDKKVKQFRATVYHTRIGHIRVTTNKHRVFECGAYDKWDPAWTWGGTGKALLYFSGSQGDAIDQLQAHFIPVSDY